MTTEGPPQPIQEDAAEGPHKKTHIRDSVAAEEVAYAEKPFRDVLAGLKTTFTILRQKNIWSYSK